MKKLTWPQSTHAHDELWVDVGDGWRTIECIQRTEHYVTILYPIEHPQAEQTERIKWTTLDRKIADGEIIAIKTTSRGYTVSQAEAVDALLTEALPALIEHHSRLAKLFPRFATVARLLAQYEAYDPQLTIKADKEAANV